MISLFLGIFIAQLNYREICRADPFPDFIFGGAEAILNLRN